MAFHRYYRRPYYRYRRYSRSTLNPFAALVLLLLSPFIFAALINPAASMGILLSLALVVGFLILIFKFLKKLFTGGNQTHVISGSAPVSTFEGDKFEINSEKHGCKCYMEGLGPFEQEVANKLSRELDYKNYFIFNNLTIPSDYNGSSQIDHLVVSRFGIFVIESKDYKGWIFGSENEEKWTQSLPGGNHKFQFENPIRQNWSHIMSLNTMMSFVQKENFRSIVVFSDSSEFKTPMAESVIHPDQLIAYVNKFSSVVIDEEKLQLIIGKLSYACQTVDITPEQHIADIQHTTHKSLCHSSV